MNEMLDRIFRSEGRLQMNEVIDILTFLGIPGDKIKSYQVVDNDCIMTIFVDLKDIRPYCPLCGHTNIKIKGYYETAIRHSIVAHKDIQVRVKNRRYVCSQCGKTFKQGFLLAEKHSSISNATKLAIVDDLKTKSTILQIAKERYVSPTTVRRILDNSILYQQQLPFPEVICIDEFCYKHSDKKEGKYPAVLSNPFTGDIIDIVPSRWKKVLIDYFNKVKLKDRFNVKYFISDMNDTYRDIHRIFFKDATYIVDRFHIIKAFNEAITKIRTRILKQEIYYKDEEYRFLKKNWKIFLMNREKTDKKKFTNAYGIIVSLSVKIDLCIRKYTELFYAYWTKQEFLKDTKQLMLYSQAEKIIDFYINKLEKNQIDEMRSIGKTFKNWRYPIINGLIRNPYKRRLTNAMAESNNNYIQTLIDAAYGLPVFERMRKRVLYINRNRQK